MTNTMRLLCGAMAFALLPMTASAQATPPAPSRSKADSIAKARGDSMAKVRASAKAAAAKAPAKSDAKAPAKAAAQAPAKAPANAPAKAAEAHDMSKMSGAPADSKQARGGMKMDASKKTKMDEMMKDPAMKAKMGEMMKDTAAMKQKMAAMPHEAGAMPGMAAMSKEEMSGWKELDGFHGLLQLTWPPIGTGDYMPAREHGAHLLEAALAWRKSHGPASCDNATLRKGMPDLIAEVRSFADAVKRGASDDAVQVTLKRTHDAFEAIAEPCMMAGMKGMTMDAKKP